MYGLDKNTKTQKPNYYQNFRVLLGNKKHFCYLLQSSIDNFKIKINNILTFKMVKTF